MAREGEVVLEQKEAAGIGGERVLEDADEAVENTLAGVVAGVAVDDDPLLFH